MLAAGCGDGSDGEPTASSVDDNSGGSPSSVDDNSGGSPSSANAATLTWLPPTQNTDGSPLDDLAGYKVYWGETSFKLDHSVTLNNPGLTSYVVENLTQGTWYFAATALNRDGDESQLSNLAAKTFREN